MSRYGDPAALRQALLKRLANQAADLGLPPERLQRRATFERLLVRLEHARPGRFVLKGGMALDVRLGARARRTRDLDLVVRDEIADGTALREIVIECLLDDPDGDGFEFLVGAPREIRADEAGRPGWGLPVDARLAGTTFAKVKVEIVDRADEITGVQRIGLPGVLAFAGMPVADVEAVDFAQHFAEKLHAYTRRYGDRENSRTKDLVDMAILVEERTDPDPSDGRRVSLVIQEKKPGAPRPANAPADSGSAPQDGGAHPLTSGQGPLITSEHKPLGRDEPRGQPPTRQRISGRAPQRGPDEGIYDGMCVGSGLVDGWIPNIPVLEWVGALAAGWLSKTNVVCGRYCRCCHSARGCVCVGGQ